MDVFSHGLWSAAIYKGANIKVKQKMKTRLAVLFGVFPDIFSFAPLFIYLFLGLIFGNLSFSDFPNPNATEPAKPDTLLIFKITSFLYSFSHSLIAFLIIFGIIFLIFKKPAWEMLAWLFHILIDIPTHSYKFYPTPFLWPVSDFKFNGFLWSEPWFLILNYSALAIVFILLRIKYRKINVVSPIRSELSKTTIGHIQYKKYFLFAIISLGIVASAAALGYFGYQNYKLKQEKAALEKELLETKQEFAETSENLLNNIDAIKQILIETQDERNNLEQDLIQKQEAMNSIEAQVQSMAGVVGSLQKLSGIDRELLKKYSRVYFLNENYIPKNLVSISAPYLYELEKDKLILGEAWPFLQKLLDDVNVAQIDIKIISAYRSFGEQSALKSAYKTTYGYGANKFSADQGYSEHQIGTAIDFTTLKLGANFVAFEKTDGYKWLMENAYKYGFILSYPKKNVYYVFEPWHWRFVGKNLAMKLHNESKNFYDLSQREIDEYLISIFDQ